ncbi:uncharacterized protein FOMMEDRAFT_127852 [Fomitiporia mediterranea MF3/22]|uniref:uncharacterized protein n=1 Tax=Fomitiporia mediterranea (strain MF3/22) TaxID=694068 RepID=UPI0004408027|nr:uncharacterized protein FOMMEDRAFT_127852 [Fomitiporia mediterranea MF3/22]EJC99667.1 hypothetical protein FOMMEDRAFT_127852 [Fomitiporia mediterranea MF3/22]
MVAFSRLVLGVAALGPVIAAPWPLTAKHATHQVRTMPNGLQVTSFHPLSQFETFGAGVDHPLSKRAEPADVEQKSVSFTASRLGVSEDDIAFKKSFTGQTATHAYLKQKINGVEVANAVANVALNSDDKVVTFGANFVKPQSVSSTIPKISSDEAISAAEKQLGATHNGFPTGLEFFAKDDGSVVLTHVVQVENVHWLETFVDAQSGEVVGVNDFTADSAFLVVPIHEQDPRQGMEVQTNPEDTAASPDGWNTGSTGTSGNNVISFKGSQSDITQESSSGLVFNFPDDDTLAPTAGTNLDSARTNAFYVSNNVHDITYRYGFTESAFNFQNDNFGKGGAGNDRVTISVQDSAGTNNADFSTPPDGQSGRMRMFLWTFTSPMRDGALENDIVSHENTHGTSNRLTGGGTGRCLQAREAGGMGEGWSDAFAEWTEQTAEVGDFTLGSYVTNDPAGIRSVPYSTDKSVDPLMYSDLQTRTEVHDIGEVWATMLHDVLAALVGVHGFSTTADTNPDGTEGNIVYMHLFIDQLALQPCNPTFLQARDAWIQADVNRYNGANQCLLWNAFAGRGLGVNAANHQNDATVPDGC